MTIKRNWAMNARQENLYKNLWKQVEKSFDFKTHQQGYRGTERYREGLRSFCKHLAIEYGSQNFKNVSDKHLQSFIEASKEAGVATSTLKTDLSSIRKLHEKLPQTRYKLSENKTLKYTDRRVTRGVDRAWMGSELKSGIQLAQSMGRKDVAWSLQLASGFGLRIEEVTALTKTQLRDALHKGYLSLNTTKGNIPRDVSVEPGMRPVLRDILDRALNERIFIGHGKAHHQAQKTIQNWIGNHRDKFQEGYSVGENQNYSEQLQIDFQRKELTFHGARHYYAREQYERRIEAGMSPQEARKEVATLLGHGRDEVTRIYLGTKG